LAQQSVPLGAAVSRREQGQTVVTVSTPIVTHSLYNYNVSAIYNYYGDDTCNNRVGYYCNWHSTCSQLADSFWDTNLPCPL